MKKASRQVDEEVCRQTTAASIENIVQSHLNVALLDVF